MFIISLTVHDKLAKMVRPVYLSARSNAYTLPKVDGNAPIDELDNQDSVRADIRRKINYDPKNLTLGIIHCFNRLNEAIDHSDFEKSEASLEMAIYLDEAQINPKNLDISDHEVVTKLK